MSYRHLTQVNGVYQFQMRVPTDLVAMVGREHWRKGLRTRDRKRAERLVAELRAKFEAEIERLRASGGRTNNAALIALLPADQQAEIRNSARRWMPGSDERLWTRSAEVQDGGRAIEFDYKSLLERGREAELVSFIHEHFKIAVQGLRDSDAALRKLAEGSVSPSGPTFDEATAPGIRAFWAGEVDRAKALLDGIGFQFTPEEAQAVSSIAAGDSLIELVERWARDNGADDQHGSANRYSAQRFVEVNGALPVRQYTKQHVRAFKDLVEQLPRTTAKEIIGLPIQEAVAAGRAAKKPPISAQTVKKHLAAINTLFNFAVSIEKADFNPAQGIKIARTRKTKGKGRKPFEAEQLNQLFASLRDAHDHQDDDFWIPVVALFAGMRVEEVCQLGASDLFDAGQGVWAFDANDEDEKRLKNEGSRRTVPVHPFLIEIGILDHWDRVKASGRLFPSLSANSKRKRFAEAYGKRFARLLREKAGIVDSQLSFHSFRHTFKTACREGALPEEVHNTFTGHAGANRVADGYGRRAAALKLAPLMAAVRFEGLDLSLLRPRPCEETG